MDSQTLSQLLDRVIADVLAQHACAQSGAQKNVRVVITGDDISALSQTLNCLTALERAGYELWVSFSHSASQSALRTACVEALQKQRSRAGFDLAPTHYEALYLPALSVNSMSKIALGIRDNLACDAVFQALQQRKAVIATLHPDCQDNTLPLPLLARYEGYAHTLESYGVAISGPRFSPVGEAPGNAPAPESRLPVTGKKRLITLRDIRLLAPGEPLCIEGNTLITPAAKDEIKRRNLTLVHG